MKAIGYFRQLGHGAPAGPDLHEAIRDPLQAPERDLLARYLASCPVLAATGTRAADVLRPGSAELLAINTRTDGDYVWPEDFAYYVAQHGARPPADFVDHVAARGGVPPALSDDELLTLVPTAREAVSQLHEVP